MTIRKENTKQELRTEPGLCRLVLTTTKENIMENAPVPFKKATTDSPIEFWVKTSSNGTQRAYYWNSRKWSVALDIALMAEAQGIATRVEAPAF